MLSSRLKLQKGIRGRIIANLSMVALTIALLFCYFIRIIVGRKIDSIDRDNMRNIGIICGRHINQM